MIHFKAAYNLPSADMNGDVNNLNDLRTTFFISSGFGIGADGKYYFNQKRNLGLTFDLMYNKFTAHEDMATIFTPTGTDFNERISMYTLALGMEYSFNPPGKTKPFIGLDLSANFISGSRELTVEGELLTAPMKPTTRFGIGFGGGVNFSVNQSVGIVVGAKYHISNFFGKDYEPPTASNEYALNDDAYTNENGSFPARTISFFQLYSGVAFYIPR